MVIFLMVQVWFTIASRRVAVKLANQVMKAGRLSVDGLFVRLEQVWHPVRLTRVDRQLRKVQTRLGRIYRTDPVLRYCVASMQTTAVRPSRDGEPLACVFVFFTTGDKEAHGSVTHPRAHHIGSSRVVGRHEPRPVRDVQQRYGL